MPPLSLEGGRYVLHEPIGQGALTVVWSAWDRHFGRLVALKLLPRSDAADPLRADEILDRVAATAGLVSEYIVRVQHVGRCDQSGLAYIDLELCEEFCQGTRRLGRSLATTAPRDVAEAARWVMQAAEGMSVAHAHGIYHRGLTPSAILVRPESRRAQVTDLGMPSVASAGAAGRSVDAQYRAPEEIAAEPMGEASRHAAAHEARVRGDVYRLGAILYELLAGHPPGAGEHGGAPAGVLAPMIGAPRRSPPRLRRTARGFLVPARLDRIVRKAMSVVPAARYASCAALADDLTRFLRNEPASVDRGRALAWPLLYVLYSRRHWRSAGLALSIAVSAVALASYAWAKREADGIAQQIASSAAELERGRAELQRVRSEVRATKAKQAATPARSSE